MQYVRRSLSLIIVISLAVNALALSDADTFESIEIIQTNGNDIRETAVRVRFGPESMQVIARSGGTVLKEWKYDSIKSAEYSYSKNPRWKTGLGLGGIARLPAIAVDRDSHRLHKTPPPLGNGPHG